MGASLGNELKHLRKATGRTLDEVAREVGVTPAALSLFENGKRNPSPKILGLLAAAFNYPVEELSSLLESERYAERLEHAQSSADEAGWTVPAQMAVRSKQRFLESRQAFSRRPIEELFDYAEPVRGERLHPSPADAPDDVLYAAHSAWSEEEEVPLKFLRATARHDPDSTTRIEAIDALADNASIALRTLRGLAEDPDPRVAREARRMLRELGVQGPHASGEAKGER